MRKPWPMVAFHNILTPNSRPYELGPTEDADLVGMRWYGMGPFHRERKLAIRIAKKSHFRIRAGDVIYNKLFAWRGAFGIVPSELDGMLVSDKFPTYALDEDQVLPSFLKWYFRHPSLWDQAASLSTGSAALSKFTLNPPQFLKLQLPLPTPAEQKRIVTQIEGIEVKLSNVKNLRNQAETEIDGLVQGVRGRLMASIPASHWAPLSTYVSEITNGWSPECETRQAADGEWGVLKVGAVSFGTYDPTENKALPASLSPIAEYEVKAGNFLMSRANNLDLVGACAVVQHTPPRLMLSDKLFRFRFKPHAQINIEFLDEVLKSPALRDQIQRQASGTSPTMKNISKDKVMNLLVPSLDLDQQTRIVRELRGLQAHVDLIRKQQSLSRAEIDALLPSILDKAFRGKL